MIGCVPLGPLSPLLVTSDVQRAIRFYRDVLGFEVREVIGEFFAIVGREGVQLLLKDPREDDTDAVTPTPNATLHAQAPWDLFVHAEDPGALLAEFRASGAGFEDALAALPPEVAARDGLIGFEVQDPSGYVLFFGRPA